MGIKPEDFCIWVFRILGMEPDDEFVDLFRTTYGPVHKAFLALDEPDRERLHGDLAALVTQFDRGPGPSVAMPSDYLEAVAVRS